VTLLSEAGCSHQQVASITGHTLKTVHHILERYLARTKGLGDQAIENWENSPRTKFANRLTAKGGTKKEHETANRLQTGTNANVTRRKKKKPHNNLAGAPRSMKMGTTLSLWHYDEASRDALQSAYLRRPTILRYA
jgi:hypothetical protein